jgi:nucleotide-binding universal stress UspA family protein
MDMRRTPQWRGTAGEGEDPMLRSILVAIDGSSHAHAALDLACELAVATGAHLTLLNVMTATGSARVPPELQEFARLEHVHITEAEVLRSVSDEILANAREQAAAKGQVDVETVSERGDPAGRIVEYATSHGMDMIVMGRRGLGDLAGLLLGSVSHKVGHLARCPCLTVM